MNSTTIVQYSAFALIGIWAATALWLAYWKDEE